ncbi:Helicase PriA essential for oriC/DnaA-independent DNA replication [hydrothermal vent metagenome]|uniref:DNA 3'-5' helicase n=1 Tax=hydrothermal vent metagenome TaxID=652676 RepID=A0A1W1C3L9_9ZZZZ
MNYYKVAILGSPLEPLTYHSSEMLKEGLIVELSLRGRRKKGVVLSRCTSAPDFQTESLYPTHYHLQKQQLRLGEFVASYYICSLGDALSIFTPFLSTIESKPPSLVTTKISLTPKQQKALEFLKEHPTSLLFGDTGSGKTEIYMKLFEETIALQKRAIFLMPEISLTPQMAKRLEEHFGEAVVMWHSKLTKKQKEKALHKIYSGKASIIAGPRSALFLPVKDLGVIVVDEEHDESYKSSKRPRYNARDLAVYMGKLLDIPVILGSATPTLSSYEKYPHIRLKGRHFESHRSFIYEHSLERLTPLILQKLQERIEKKEQSIIFVPTRANFKYLQCAECGEGFECAFCNVGMSLHRNIGALKCHYCGFTQAIPKMCPKCGSNQLVSSRLGTAEVVQELKEHFPKAVIEQFDRDTITTQTKLKKLLKRFNDNEIDILVGTQMLSKGHDYHDVTLAVILGMDNMLGLPDYRARERALASLIQIAGRSGRKRDAEVIIQSFNEEFFSTFVEDFDAFLEEEKFYREGLYPPYKRLARILFAHKNAQKAKEQMQKMVANLQRFEQVQIVGYGECAIAKVAGKYRYEILLRTQKATELIKAIRASLVDLAEVDMDPLEFS